MANHLAIYSNTRSKDYIGMMFSGKKTVDIKLSYRKIAPYKKIETNDWIYIKVTGGPVVGRIQVSDVEYYDIDNSIEILEILKKIRIPVGLMTKERVLSMYEKVKYKRYVTVFTIKNPQLLELPIKIFKRDRRVWIPDYKLTGELKFAYEFESEPSEQDFFTF